MKFNVRSLYNLTRNPRSKKDREAGILSVTAQSELKEIAKKNILMEDITTSSSNLALQKSKSTDVKKKAVELINKVTSNEFVFDGTHSIENESLIGYYDILDSDNNAIHLIVIPYTLLNHELTEDDILNSSGFLNREYRARGLMLIMNSLGLEIDKCYIHYCFVDTPEEFVDMNNPQLHKMKEGLNESYRVTTTCIQRDLDIETEINDCVNKSKLFYEEYLKNITNFAYGVSET